MQTSSTLHKSLFSSIQDKFCPHPIVHQIHSFAEYTVSFNVSGRHWGRLGLFHKNPVLSSDQMCLWWSKPAYDQWANMQYANEMRGFAWPAAVQKRSERKQVSRTSCSAFTDPKVTVQTSDAAAAFWGICQSEVRISHTVADNLFPRFLTLWSNFSFKWN